MTIMAQEICDAALHEFKAAPHNGSRKGDRLRQVYVEFRLASEDLEYKSLIEFVDQTVKPAIALLSENVPEDVIFLDLEPPTSVLKTAKAGCLRFIADVSHRPVAYDDMRKPTEYELVTIGRFDVLFELA